jgi:uncharacterized membrane protein YtjA (UPF0391 family)
VALIGIGQLWPSTVQSAIRRGDPIETLFQAMVTAVITGVTLVVSINQLVLSQELGPAGDQQERMEGALEFRSDAESHIDEAVSPADPAAFLQSLLAAIQSRASALASAGGSANDAALDFDDSLKINEARRLRARHGDSLTDDADSALEAILETLQLFGTAREHFKTLYFQWEFINLSRVVLYAAVPALTTGVAMILFFDGPGSVPGQTAGVANVLWLVTLATLVPAGTAGHRERGTDRLALGWVDRETVPPVGSPDVFLREDDHPRRPSSVGGGARYRASVWT